MMVVEVLVVTVEVHERLVFDEGPGRVRSTWAWTTTYHAKLNDDSMASALGENSGM